MKRRYEREPWGKPEWLVTMFLLVVFFPIGAAALIRYLNRQYVWFPETAHLRRPG